MRKIFIFIVTLAIILTITLPLACTVASAKTTGTAGNPAAAIKAAGTLVATQHRTRVSPANGTPYPKKRKPFSLGFDLKPYLAVIALLFVAVKTVYARTSSSFLKYSKLL